MTERYENWRDLKPLEAPVPVGTKCVVLTDDGYIKEGDIVVAIDLKEPIYCTALDGERRWPMNLHELALLPTESTAPTASTEYSEWRKREVWDCAKRLYASPEFGSAAGAIEGAETLMAEWERRYNK